MISAVVLAAGRAERMGEQKLLLPLREKPVLQWVREGALFIVGDQPMIRPEIINALIERFEKSSALIVAPSFQGHARNPVLFRRDLFPDLLRLKGDRGGRALLETYRDRTDLVEWIAEIPFIDLDVREDYEKLKDLA